MTLSDAGLIASVCVNFVAVYAAFRKQRTTARQADAHVDAEIEGTAIERWQAYAARLETKIDALDKLLEGMRVREIECARQTAKQEEQIKNLEHSVKGLRADLKRAGITPGTTEHDKL